jgi:LAS superfamily LD-carboxypeptidase LdcB
MLTSELPALTTGVLGLMGISAATGLGAAVVDSGKRTGEENERDALEQKKKSTEAEIEKLNAEIAALQASTKANPAPADLDQQLALLAEKQSQVATKNKEIQQDEAVIKKLDEGTRPTPSKSFVKDILSDDDGISFHRFQIAAWTIVLILIFLAKVFHQFSMPEFDGTLLALMGISAGTYIGFKLPNQQG